MKKITFLTGIAAMSLMALAACSGSKAADNADPEATLAEKNVGVDQATDGDDEATLAEQSADAAAVVVLTDDNVYRPDMKVDHLTVLDFNATWCGPCKQFAPVFHAAAEKFGKNVTFVSIDTDVNPETANAFGVKAIPTVVFLYPNGNKKTFVGTEDLLPDTRFFALVQGEM